MRKSERYPAVTIEHGEFCIRVDFDPRNKYRPREVYVWRRGKTTHDIDLELAQLSRMCSRVIQKQVTV